VTTSLLTPRRRPRPTVSAATSDTQGSTNPTLILDWQAAPLAALSAGLGAPADERAFLQRAHGVISAKVRPVYAVNDAQSASRTLSRGRGSCSQRLAILEAVARSAGIATRVQGLLIDGRFWYPRFPRLQFAVPETVLLAWPEFHLRGTWVSASQLFDPADPAAAGFTNAGVETLFDALARGAVDWDGTTSSPGACSSCDLSTTVVADLGLFASRDDLFAAHGQTLCWPARTLAEPVLSRWSAGTRAAAA
jgi:transglutaminase-like putative cysteine protease